MRSQPFGNEMISHPIRIMTLPKTSQIQPGVGVNIISKADQRSGKITTGQVSEILTRGDHPRGIKVCLIDGRVGRVQSLSASPATTILSKSTDTAEGIEKSNPSYSTLRSGRFGPDRRRGKINLQEDYREDSVPLESRSLADYVISSASSKSVSKPQTLTCGATAQSQLERDFPNLDTALVAAILADHDDPEAARGILSTLS